MLFGETNQISHKERQIFADLSITPVSLLKNKHKEKLELMERNSLKNLKYFLIRCI